MEKTKVKEWFEYRDGYVNIDDRFIYFTSTGNWMDAHSQNLYNNKLNLKAILFYILFIGGGLLFLYFKLQTPKASVIGLLFTILTLYLVFENHARFKNKTFKIPLEEIISLQIGIDSATIHFNHSRTKNHLIEIKEIEGNGISILQKLKLNAKIDYSIDSNES